MKTDVEQMLPRKKEIILYATMTDHQKNFQDHLVNKTLEDYLIENASAGTRSILLVKSSNEFALRKERHGTQALCNLLSGFTFILHPCVCTCLFLISFQSTIIDKNFILH